MKLQSMTDYVLEQRKNQDTDNIRRFWACERYTNFLKQPLTLSMFVPTDENGNVLDEDGTDGEGYILDKIMHDEFQQAKDRVIFEGFEKTDFGAKNSMYEFYFGSIYTAIINDGREVGIAITIEDLVKYSLTITETAVKKYGL